MTKQIRELLVHLTPMMGFKIKMAEQAGTHLRNRFSLTRLWEGTKCGRSACVTCEQGAEELPSCTRSSVVYEKICHAILIQRRRES